MFRSICSFLDLMLKLMILFLPAYYFLHLLNRPVNAHYVTCSSRCWRRCGCCCTIIIYTASSVDTRGKVDKFWKKYPNLKNKRCFSYVEKLANFLRTSEFPVVNVVCKHFWILLWPCRALKAEICRSLFSS